MESGQPGSIRIGYERIDAMSEFDKMVEFLDATYSLKNQLVPCLIGPVGIGKTEAVKQHAKNIKAKNVVKIVASQILPSEVSGITMPDPETKAMEIYDHFKLGHMEDGDILFFDELLEADQLVLSACLTLLESRELMSGRRLPDIQIVAATNPSIKPDMLKENIRQRFLFRHFDIDKHGTRKFILNDCGIDVDWLTNKLESTSSNYNILSPRSLTKMARWMAGTKDKDEGERVAKQIDLIWNNDMGHVLFNAKYNKSPKMEARETLRLVAYDNIGENEDLSMVDWTNDKMSDIMKVLSSMINFDDIKESLEKLQIDTEDQRKE